MVCRFEVCSLTGLGFVSFEDCNLFLSLWGLGLVLGLGVVVWFGLGLFDEFEFCRFLGLCFD